MSTFIEAVEDFLDYINRPASEMEDVAKRELNMTLLWMQRVQRFNLAERVATILYPANTPMVNISAVCEGKIRNFNHCVLGGNAGVLTGRPLFFKTFDQITQEKFKFDRSRTLNDEDLAHGDDVSFSGRVSRELGYYAFISGDKLGLYPTPTSDVTISVDVHIWLPPLVEDNDTNFLLDFCYDFVILKTLQRYNIYSKQESRNPISEAELSALWQGVKDWDGQVISTTPATV